MTAKEKIKKPNQDDSGVVKLFHPRGPQVTLPVTAEPLNYGAMLVNVSLMLDAGWLPFAPGLEEGEEREEIGWVCRLDHEKDGEMTPTVLLYSSNQALSYSFLRRYLNSHADVEAFEFAARVKYDALPAYPGNDHPQRGASQKADRFIIAVPKPFGLVWKQNPRYKDAPAGQDTRSLSEKRKRDFVRWVDQKPNGEAPATAQDSPPPQPAPSTNGNGGTATKRTARDLLALEVRGAKMVEKCLTDDKYGEMLHKFGVYRTEELTLEQMAQLTEQIRLLRAAARLAQVPERKREPGDDDPDAVTAAMGEFFCGDGPYDDGK